MSGEDKKLLVYHYRAKGSPVVKDGLAVVTEKQLSDILELNQQLQRTSKAIPRGTLSVDVHQKDLVTPEQVAGNESKISTMSESNVAGVKIPFGVALRNCLAGSFPELIILSEKH